MRAFAVPEATTTDLTEIELPTPAPTGTEVVLEVVRSGVCHTDTHLRAGYYDLGRRGQMRLTDRGVPYPLVMGHEVVGVVIAAGPDVQDVEVGSTRLVYPWVGCGECPPCLDGRENACPRGRNIGVARAGGYAEQVLVPHPRYLVDIEGLDLSWAATMACSGLTAYSAARKVLPLPADAPIVVIGVGGVGLTAVATLSALGHRAICAVDTSPANLAAAQELGASHTVTAEGDDVAAKLLATTGGPVPAVIDFVNNDHTAPVAFEALAKGGHMVQVGLFGGEMTIPTALLALKMITIQGSFVGTLPELHEVVELAKRGDIPRIPVHDAPLDLAGVTVSLDRLAAGGVTGRIVLKGAEK
ncbi:alcohol dehydrogenase catalytic domain-containing protein [Nocardioides sp. J2M5]|uniref:alcohol dehydrogenase n=1 Tax=Nocardioides TaxID=1839 RepID=UPI001BA91EED|nr:MULTISPECIES: alcohol dehydrogenase [Nocardioides]MBS2937969.1 alcohol dehydrogenase catalytic domain-containing protein [Nocardioides palaemonis]